MKALSLALGGALLVALVGATLLDAVGATSIRFGAPWCALVAVLGAAQGAAWPALLGPRGVSGRRAAIGFATALALAFALGRAPFGWLDLGAIAAGLPGELPLVVLPLASLLAVLTAWPPAPAGSNDPG